MTIAEKIMNVEDSLSRLKGAKDKSVDDSL